MYAQKASKVLGLATLTLVALFFIEGVPARFATPETLAWHCEAMTASPTTIVAGESSTLTWHFAADSDVSVTIDELAGQSWTGVSGSTSVSPTESKTYTARAHKSGTDETFTCSVRVEVTPPVVVDDCAATSLSIDNTSFTWNGGPRMEQYDVTFCDGSSTGVVEGCWEQNASMSFGARIKSVSADGGSCHKEVTQTCPVAPPVEEPEWPACPYTADTNTTVVEFDGKGLIANGSEADAKSGTYTVSLPAGTYTLKSASWDGYSWRAGDGVQPFEQWNLVVRDASGTLFTSSATTDLDDGVLSSLKTDTLSTNMALSRTATQIQAVHAKYWYESRQSVQPVCVAFVKHAPPVEDPAPTCTMSVSSTNVSRDSKVTLNWTSDNATTASINQGIGSVSVDGEKIVNVTSDTTYTGTFTGDKGKSVTCSASVSIRSGGGGSCLNCKDKPTDKPKDKPKDIVKDISPKIILSKTITKAGGYVSLDQVPYTGFEAGPALTMFFWLAVLALSGAIAYVVTYLHPIARLRQAFASERIVRAHRAREDYVASVVEETRAAMNSSVAPVAVAYSTPLVASTATSDHSISTIEDRAHADSILLSPEATRMIAELIAKADTDEKSLLDTLFGSAKDTYPREDGWILLSKERTQSLLTRVTPAPVEAAPVVAVPVPVMQTTQADRPFRSTPPVLSGDHQVATVAPAQAPVASTSAPTAAPRDESEALAQFVQYLVTGEQQKTFDLLRTMTGKGIATESFIAHLVRKLDDIYKNRLEGNHSPDPALAMQTATWSNGDFETVLGILVECIDYSYTSTRIGTKVALAKAFEYFARKK